MNPNLLGITIADVQDLIGKPYVHGARGPDAFDCWGVCVEVYRRGGIALPDYAVEHLTHAQTADLVRGVAVDHGDWIARPEDWCFVFDRRGGHVGLHWRGSVLHAARTLGCVVQNMALFEATHPSVAFARWRA